MAVATTEEPVVGFQTLQPLWHAKAPRKLVESHTAGDTAAGWKSWQKHIRGRRTPASPPFIEKKQPAVLWAWPDAWQGDTIRKSLASPTILAELAIDDDASAAPDLPSSLQLVALAYALPKLAKHLPAETWWLLVERLHGVAAQARSEHVDWQSDPEGLLRNQLLAGELPLALGYLFPEVRSLRALRDEARASLSEALVELTDGQGLPQGRLFPVLGPLFACWTRCRWLGEHLHRGPWSRTADLQYQWLVRHAIRLADAEETFLLSAKGVDEVGDARASRSRWCKPLFEMALDLAGDRGDHAAAFVALPRGVVNKRKRFKHSDLPQPSLNSDWAGATIISDGWSQSAPRVAIKYVDAAPKIAISAGGKPLFVGDWTFSTICDGQAVHAVGEWEQLCWESGKQYDFLELGVSLSSDLRLERQILFGREDRILYLADVLLTTDGASKRLQHSVELPLARGAEWKAEAETRDGTIIANKVRAAVLPLALQEWRADPRGGSLTAADKKLVLTQTVNARAVCCPLMIDLNSKRSASERTWRQLTVAEWMEIVPADVAVGFRAQSGDDQWLVYRSLGPVGNRTLLGHNIAGEFCAGRFLSTGKFKEWIEIEAV